jgi:hypothetical protein
VISRNPAQSQVGCILSLNPLMASHVDALPASIPHRRCTTVGAQTPRID